MLVSGALDFGALAIKHNEKAIQSKEVPAQQHKAETITLVNCLAFPSGINGIQLIQCVLYMCSNLYTKALCIPGKK